MQVRPWQTEDTPALAAIYHDAVVAHGPRAYDAQQVAMWASFATELETNPQRFANGTTLVVIDDACGGQIVAFAQLNPADTVDLLYTRPSHGRRGLASMLVRKLEAIAISQSVNTLWTHASHLSRPCFERLGFVVHEVEVVARQGLQFERFVMKKQLGQSSATTPSPTDAK